ncbi:hypothetical protein E3Q23_02635 [Wallemia mellicola]|uniref:DASH complex subunit DUO1 n=1 Tax=Wallemia mellicola TaxID=1708541 RepID=A0A4T0QNB2_9BASI|nr:hypothetical protein E3Q23_02635 [Wallemia mellicola]TIB99309.1 hypothetical protein E3Q17_02677 [Wallemia mellicola]TIC10529.1 hypothetical protein E3Q14_02767 [Wallemia mellicola]TIC25328.1 hypothetical protein E3Q11_03419 [Wallemia mellicola]TIC29248.1 hypothetical protein E3Q10_02698 [Wallemia mellicola]
MTTDLQQQSFSLADDTDNALSVDDLTRSQRKAIDLEAEEPNELDREAVLQAELDALIKFRQPLEASVEALCVAQEQNHRLAERVEQTSTLLDEYTRILRQQEHTRNLMLNTHWKGATEDVRAVEEKQRELERQEYEAAQAEERRRVEAELAREREAKEAEMRATAAASAGNPSRGSVRGRGRVSVSSTRGRALVSYALAADTQGFDDPTENGGKWITQINSDSTLGEPLNIVISGDSDPLVLTVDTNLAGCFYTYWDSLSFMQEFAGIHLGGDQLANVGDGLVPQQGILRYNYNDRNGGTLFESQHGGNHIRYWNQTSSNAIFIAASAEMSKAENHMIIPDGYNIGRDWIAGNATGQEISNATASQKITGQSTGYWTRNGDAGTNVSFTYETEVTYQAGLISNDSTNINHADAVGVNGQPPQDGLVALFKKTIR